MAKKPTKIIVPADGRTAAVYRRVPLALLDGWDKNPRGIKDVDFERLKDQITRLGEYKPLIVTPENGRFVVLGGNMRLLALRELGAADVAVSIVNAKTDRERLEYSLSDNDRAGYYEEDRLAEIALENIEGLDLELFKIDVEPAKSVLDVVDEFGPDLKVKPTEVEYPETFDKTVDFKFGDYQGRVGRGIYDSFVEELNRIRVATGAILLDEVLRAWLGGDLGGKNQDRSVAEDVPRPPSPGPRST